MSEMDNLGELWPIAVFSVVLSVLCGLYAVRVARRKNRGVGESFALGALLGLIGIVIVALLPAGTKGSMEQSGQPGKAA